MFGKSEKTEHQKTLDCLRGSLTNISKGDELRFKEVQEMYQSTLNLIAILSGTKTAILNDYEEIIERLSITKGSLLKDVKDLEIEVDELQSEIAKLTADKEALEKSLLQTIEN